MTRTRRAHIWMIPMRGITQNKLQHPPGPSAECSINASPQGSFRSQPKNPFLTAATQALQHYHSPDRPRAPPATRIQARSSTKCQDRRAIRARHLLSPTSCSSPRGLRRLLPQQRDLPLWLYQTLPQCARQVAVAVSDQGFRQARPQRHQSQRRLGMEPIATQDRCMRQGSERGLDKLLS